MEKTTNLMIVGVGGQGTLLASRLLGHVLLAEGHDVKVSEVHGMSQRGGSVVTYVRYGKKVYSPVVTQGEADYIIAFEKLEAARWLPYLRKGGSLILGDQEIQPMPVITGAMAYPAEILEKLKDKGVDLTSLDALSLAKEAGNAKCVNVVLMGVLSKRLPFGEARWQEALEACVPAKALAVNQRAFALGRGV